MLTLICPKCGKEKNKDLFIESVCRDCYLNKKQIIDLKVKEITLCKKCGREKRKFMWQSVGEDEIQQYLEENLKIDLPEYEINSIDLDFYKNKIIATVTVSGIVNNQKITSQESFNIALNSQYCDDCYKSISDYYQATIQVRYDNTTLERYKEELGKKSLSSYIIRMMENVIKEQRKEGDFLANIQKIEETKNGFNIYIGSKQQAIEFIKAMKPIFQYDRKDSSSLIGQDKTGKGKVRYTYLLRLK